ncbi:SusC/RagA family TonB-linked outer membrane protein [Albibacterium bauzanense]|uniref:SusC/RagA family TonB-linked outer membrane protein n=1 Tax=Albibacterium bauzanense TaxID=653929 RepID=UPI001046B1D0|nr:TonB-dependent receptor [Albibacterium bauzanense]
MKRILTLLMILSCYGFSSTYAQNISITGTVKDGTGLTLPGVSVQVKNSTQGSAADANGNYSISAPANATLVFSFIGFKTLEEPVNNRQTINVTLTEDNTTLNDVIVIGYGSQAKKDITTAVTSISADEIQNQPVTNPLQAIQGKAAGVQITSQSGKPGSGVAVSIRGNTSITASNSPLYVIDGITSRDASFLNPNDIETITVLKDASAAAIYGSSGANGVILITTKKGKLAGRPQIALNAFTGISNLWQKQDVLDRDQYLDLMTELGYTDLGDENRDWQDETFGTGVQQNYQLSVSGATNTGGNYYISGGYLQDKGIVAPAVLNRYTLNFNGSQSATDWLRFTANLAVTRSNSVDVSDNAGVARGGTILSALTTPPTIGIFEEDGIRYTQNPYKGGWENPIANAFAAENSTKNTRFLGAFSAEVDFTKDLSFKSSISINKSKNDYDYWIDPFSTNYGRTQEGVARTNHTDDQVWLNENLLNYNKNFGDHAFTATAGMTLQESDWKYRNTEVTRFLGEDGELLEEGTSVVPTLPQRAQWSKRSYLARVTYNYLGKYLLSSNFRADGSSRFAPDQRYGYFPSVSAGWRISSEDFMSNAENLDDLKLRASWGQVGNDEGIGDYAYLALYNLTTQGSYSFAQLANPDLTWEKTTQSNLGLDLTMFDGRLAFTADAYIKKTDNLLVNVQLPPSSGFPSQALNVGSMENKGFEFLLSTRNIQRDKFTWSSDINLSINKNKVTSLGSSTESLDFGGIYERTSVIKIEPGRPLGSFYGYVFEGVNPETGDAVYKDIDGVDGITPDDRTYIGSAQPKFTYGFNNTLTYNNWGLSLFFQGVQGNDMFNASRIDLESMNDSKNQSSAVLDRWKKPGDITNIPGAKLSNTDNTLTSSRFVENGSYLRLKTATLSYNFGDSFLAKTKLSKFMVYATGYNLLTVTNYTGFDPEVNQYGANGPSMGVDYGTYPQSRTFMIGINVGF